jgi:hypothetical protein
MKSMLFGTFNLDNSIRLDQKYIYIFGNRAWRFHQVERVAHRFADDEHYVTLFSYPTTGAAKALNPIASI